MFTCITYGFLMEKLNNAYVLATKDHSSNSIAFFAYFSDTFQYFLDDILSILPMT